MITHRSSGILAHITSLPSPYGVGDLGKSSDDFLRFLEESGQSYWQILPTTPTLGHFDNSPYMSISAFAGNPLLISPDSLVADGFISTSDLEGAPECSTYLVEFEKLQQWKKEILTTASTNFFNNQQLKDTHQEDYQAFKEAASSWLLDYCTFMTAKEVFGGASWNHWPKDIALRNKKALEAFAREHKKKIRYYVVEQFLFAMQWQKMKKNAEARGIQIFGDIPIYVSYDSVDVWANRTLFVLDPEKLTPTLVAGVPPDYFSETGQRWGNPLYDWQNRSPSIRKKLYDWWGQRLQHTFSMVDITRIDHFRGFESYWAIPEENETAETGEWLPGPGILFFEAMKKRVHVMNIVAEDLGVITQEVRDLREKVGFPGMKVLLFAFDGNPENTFLPHTYTTTNSVVYTGTHDNNTVVGWFFNNDRTDEERRRVKIYTNGNPSNQQAIHHDMIYLAMSSVSTLAILPLQDILGFGDDCRMNTPGQAEGNWRWRCPGEYLDAGLSSWVKETTIRFSRGRKTKQQETC